MRDPWDGSLNNTILLVKGLDKPVSGEDLSELFSQYGKVTESWVREGRDEETGEFYRVGFVELEDWEQASHAYHALRRKRWRGMRLKVSYAQPHL